MLPITDATCRLLWANVPEAQSRRGRDLSGRGGKGALASARAVHLTRTKSGYQVERYNRQSNCVRWRECVDAQRAVAGSLASGGVRADGDLAQDGLDGGAAPVGVPLLPGVAHRVRRRDVAEHRRRSGQPVVLLAGPGDAVIGALLDVEPVFLVDDVLGPVAACLGALFLCLADLCQQFCAPRRVSVLPGPSPLAARVAIQGFVCLSRVAEEAGAAQVGGDVGGGRDEEAAKLRLLGGVEAALGDRDAHVAEHVARGVEQGRAEADRAARPLAAGVRVAAGADRAAFPPQARRRPPWSAR